MENIPQWASGLWRLCRGRLAEEGLDGGRVAQFDVDQQKVLHLGPGDHLVLAPPGCGKTEILAQRLLFALDSGLDSRKMLSLTFTNRASRGMRERVRAKAGERARDVFVGNLHAFCHRFLFEQHLIPQLTEIVDEDDQRALASEILSPAKIEQRLVRACRQGRHGDEYHLDWAVLEDFALAEDNPPTPSGYVRRPRKDSLVAQCVQRVAQVAHYLDQKRRGHGADVLLHPELEGWTRRDFLAPYAEGYLELCRGHGYADFDDLLVWTYDRLLQGEVAEQAKYEWMQVDEVQDLNPLQLSIARMLLAPRHMAVYFGDEQQAIFSFMGAKLETLEELRKLCGGESMRLRCNYRSPPHLLQLCNEYAEKVLGVDAHLLPTAAPGEADPSRPADKLIKYFGDVDEAAGIVSQALPYYLGQEAGPDGSNRTAIIVPTNAMADRVSDELKNSGHPHFKISGVDIFKRRPAKALFAHIQVAHQPQCVMPWARLMAALGVLPTERAARRLVARARDIGVRPTDFLRADGGGLLLDFCQASRDETVVVFDTETTGLDVAHDDIVQIAAVKLRRGAVVEGSGFCVFLETGRAIPAMLGDMPNPLVEEYARHEKRSRAEGLRAFAEYADGAALLAHNAAFDFAMLRANLSRAGLAAEAHAMDVARTFDSLAIARVLFPRLRAYKLKDLLAHFGLEGRNSHLADDDVAATAAFVRHCLAEAGRLEGPQRAFLQENGELLGRFRQAYGPFHEGLRQRMDGRGTPPASPYDTPLVAEMYEFRKHGRALRLEEADKEALDRILLFLDQDVVDAETFPALREQVAEYATKLGTFGSADLCESASLEDRIFVSTVHKAKGLEFENVIVAMADDNNYPRPSERREDRKREAARVLYVALSRARRRLCLTYAQGTEWRQTGLSPFVREVRHHFLFSGVGRGGGLGLRNRGVEG